MATVATRSTSDLAEARTGLAGHRTDLSVDRTVMAASRTLMGWIRTALSLISFGFTIYKFMEAATQGSAIGLIKVQGPRRLGLTLIAMGIGIRSSGFH